MKFRPQRSSAIHTILVLLVLVSGCSIPNRCDDRPCSVSEVLIRLAEAKNPIPVYVPKTGSPYSNIVSNFYYYDNGSETRLVTIFTSNKEDTRIARMITSVFLEPLDMFTTRYSRKVIVDWANEASASTYDLIPGKFVDDSLTGTPYQTFLVWGRGSLWFHFYSVLPLDEALELVNSLEKVKP